MEQNSDIGKDFVEAGVEEQKSSSSFELKKTSRGINFCVKIYACDTVEDIERAMGECRKRFDLFLGVYGGV